MTQRTMLGLEGPIEQARVDSLVDALRTTWFATIGRLPGCLEDDLEAARRWFDPVAQGQRLRRELGELDPLPAEVLDPGEPLTFRVDDDRRLVTPEGRCALDLLESLPRSPSGHMIRETQISRYERQLGLLYREWSRHRLQSVVGLLSGHDKPLQIPAAGVVIALLVNRCTSEERALIRFAGAPREVVDRAFFSPVQAFADILAPSARRSRGNPRLVSGWMLYEARRRLGDGLVVIDARAGRDGKVWIRPDAIDNVIDVVARDLARGHRARATPDRFSEAFDALVAELRRQLPSLAGWGLVHERPIETKRLRERVIDRLDRHLAGP